MPAEELRTRICSVGACFTDLIAYSPRAPGAGETLVGNKFATGFGGKGANQAVQAARLGAEVMMVSKLGDDTFAHDTLRNFEAQGVDTAHVTKVLGASSGVAPIVVDESTGQNSIIIIPGALEQLTAGDVEKARGAIRRCHVLLTQLEAPVEATLAALKIAREEGVMTVLNTAPAKKLPDEVWSLCDIVCPNEGELQALTGMPTASDTEVEAAAGAILRKGAKKVLVTLGHRGSALFEDGAKPAFVAGNAVEAKDTTGAGDSFLGALAARLVAGDRLETAMLRAGEVAAVSVTREGTQKSFPAADEMLARHATGLIDHTSLGLDDTEARIRALVDAAVATKPHTAAVCIYPKFVKFIRSLQKEHPDWYPRTLKVCTVVNFPGGKEPTEKVVQDTKQAVEDGADEVDLVIDYCLLREDEKRGREAAEALVKAVRAECPTDQVALKVIIESGELAEERLIRAASEAAIAGGCDFVKTSTGKVKVNATPEAARIMLQTIATYGKAVAGGRTIGFKAAGGVRDVVQSRQYLELAAEVLLGDRRRYPEVNSRLLRFGASSLLPALRASAGAVPNGERKTAKDRSAPY